MTADEARIRAAALFIERYGVDFIRDNLNKRLFTTVMDLGESFLVNFELFKNTIVFTIEDEIDNKEDVFPDIVLSVNVNKTDGTIGTLQYDVP